MASKVQKKSPIALPRRWSADKSVYAFDQRAIRPRRAKLVREAWREWKGRRAAPVSAELPLCRRTMDDLRRMGQQGASLRLELRGEGIRRRRFPNAAKCRVPH